MTYKIILVAFIFLLPLTVLIFSCKKDKSSATGGIPSPVDTLPPPPGDPTPQDKKWLVTTIAGSGIPFFADGPALSARFRLPLDVAVTDDGAIYVADGLNHRIRKISGGIVSSFAGIGFQDTTNGTGTSAGYSIPIRLATDQFSNLYSLDVIDARVRMITPNAVVSTRAGKVTVGFADGPVFSSLLGRCLGIVCDADGNIYLGDNSNKRIRKITANGQVITIAGTGVMGFKDGIADSAEFFNPQGIAIDQQGNLFVADQTRIRKITPNGIVSTFAGSEFAGIANGPADQARFIEIADIVIDQQGNIYAADENRIRKITPQAVVTTIAGSTQGYSDGVGTAAKFNRVLGLGIDKQGRIYAADADNYRIRKISFE